MRQSGEQPGEITLYLPNGGPVHSPSVFETPGDFRGQRVPMVSLDRCEALNDVPVIDMVKIDVEGSEPDVVDGMRGLIAAGRVRRVLCEFNSGWLKINNTSVDQLADQFRELGFDIESKTPWQTGPTSDGGQFHVQDVLYRHRSAPRGKRYFAKARALFDRVNRALRVCWPWRMKPAVLRVLYFTIVDHRQGRQRRRPGLPKSCSAHCRDAERRAHDLQRRALRTAERQRSLCAADRRRLPVSRAGPGCAAA